MSQNKEIKSGEKQGKNKPIKVVLIILAVLIVLTAVFAYVFRRYVNILFTGVSKSDEQIHSMQAENDKKTHDILNELVVVTMRDLTDEERQMLERGELTPEQALALIKGATLDEVTATAAEVVTTAPVEIVTTAETTAASTEATTVCVDEPVVTTAKTTTTTTTTTTTAQAVTTEPIVLVDTEKLRARIEEIIAEIYLLRANYLNAIDKTIYEAKLEYMALPKSKHTLQGKMQFVTTNLVPKGNALEAECDAKINELLTELESILKELGDSTAIIDEIRKVYKEQKDLKLTELTNQYSSKLK